MDLDLGFYDLGLGGEVRLGFRVCLGSGVIPGTRAVAHAVPSPPWNSAYYTLLFAGRGSGISIVI